MVDDNEANRQILERMLRRLGYEVDVAIDGESALAQLTGTSFDAVLMDCAMPGRDGYATTRELRAREADGAVRVPVIALTADISAGARDRCLEAGMDDYLSKPVRREQLAACLDRWLSAGAQAVG